MDIGEQKRIIQVEPEPLQAPVEEPAREEPAPVEPERQQEPVPVRR